MNIFGFVMRYNSFKIKYGKGLRIEIMTAFGKTKTRQILGKYPDFNIALESYNWPLALDAVDDALAAGDITQTQYDKIQTEWDKYHLPRS